MYKIYINENILELKDAKDITNGEYAKGAMLAPYNGKKTMLLSYIDMLEKTNKFKHVILYHSKLKTLRRDTKSLFTIVQAGGGLVVNDKDKVLLIFRKGHWDLPKGKREKGEKKRVTAVREVEEETGVRNLIIQDKINVTHHLYRIKKGKRALKKTHWYLMETHNQKLTPQTKEDIVKAEWKDLNKFMKKELKMYLSIREVIDSYMNQSFQIKKV
jgi:8-oxo-dGTP pyrophosphatase MutT (NUDIX family)